MRHRRVAKLLLAAIAAFACCGSPPARADTLDDPPLSGTLTYSRLTNGTWQIWRRDMAAGSGAQLTYSPGDKRYPAWTADGRVSFCTSNQTCFFVAENGEVDEPIFKDLWPLRDVVWSPLGAILAFSKFRTDLIDSANLWTSDLAGVSRQMLTREAGIQSNAALSPDGQRLAYSGGQGPGSYELYVIDADGGNQRRLTTNQHLDFSPAWSPDGRRLAFTSNATGDFEIWTIGVDGSGLTQLTRSPGLDSRPA